jgi:hypothetical protein
MKPLLLPCLAVLMLAIHAPGAGDAPKAAPAKPVDAQVKAVLVTYCVDCHREGKAKGDLRLDTLPADFDAQATRDHWLHLLKRVRAGEMPPDKKTPPSPKEVEVLSTWITAQADAAVARRAAEGRVVLRRLNRTEYENTVRDLLGVVVDLKDMLPPDSSAHGFDNNGEALHLSSFLMDRYLEAADTALNAAIANLPKPPLVKKRFTLKDERVVKNATESVFLKRDDDLVMFSSSAWNAITTGQFYPPDRGTYRVRISVAGHQTSGKPVAFRVDAGPMLMGQKNHLVGYFDAPPGKPAVVEFLDHFEARHSIRILPYGLAGAQTVTKVGAEKYEGPGLAVQWVEVEGPLNDTWPPESHRRVFGDLPQIAAPIYNARTRVEVTSKNPEADAELLLRAFARRAFRRPVTDADVQPFVELVREKLAEKHSFEQAMRVGLKAVLVSPDFLFLREQPGKLNDFAIASRLSYFLWSTTPDDELLALAGQNKLGTPAVLRGQVERMLKHPKAKAFTENFVGQWLGTRDIDFTSPDPRLYPEFDDLLKDAMVQEVRLFFDEVLTADLSLTNFVASDFTLLNERLAKHYGIPGVEGLRFRKVALAPGTHRGGVLTMAGVLKVTANGTSTSPVTRGAWVLDRILGTPPPPPPSGVPAVEPDIRGATTMREQLARHREIGACASCHVKIDPPGFALESFDVIGGWRDNYRTVGRGEAVVVDGRRMAYHKGLKVDPADVLADGRQFRDIDEYKQLLLKDKDQLARALTGHLLTYATGAPPGPGDVAAIDAVVGKVRDQNYGLRALVHEIVLSKPFRHK